MARVTADRIFSTAPRRNPAVGALVAGFGLVVLLACSIERGEGDGLFVLFALPSALFNFLVGRWWAVVVPVALTAFGFAVGVECSVSETPQALMLAGTPVGVLTRLVGERVAGRR